METGAADQLFEVLRVIGLVIGLSLLLAGLLFYLSLRRLRRLEIREGAGPIETLRAIPFGVALGLDLLDLSLDVFAAPVSWWILRRYRLAALRDLAVVEALIPGTQLLPLLSFAWIFARLAPPDFELGGGRIIEGAVIDLEARSAEPEVIDAKPTETIVPSDRGGS